MNGGFSDYLLVEDLQKARNVSIHFMSKIKTSNVPLNINVLTSS